MPTEQLAVVDKYTTALEQENVTEKVIQEIKEKYLPLKINGIDDKEGYKEVRQARIYTKNLRVLAVKICKKGREEAIAEQKAWVSKEKEITSQIAEVEQHLEEQEKWFEAEKQRIKEAEEARLAAIKAEEERQLQEKIKMRAEQLLAYGITGDYDTLKDSSDEEFEQVVNQAKESYEAEQARLAELEAQKQLSKQRYANLLQLGHAYPHDDLGTLSEAEFDAIYSAIAEEKNRKDKEAQEEKERLEKIAGEQEAERQRLAEQRRQQEEREEQFKAEQEQLAAEKKAVEDAKLKARLAQLKGTTFDGEYIRYCGSIIGTKAELLALSENELEDFVDGNNKVYEQHLAEEEAKRQADIENAKKAEAEKAKREAERQEALKPDIEKVSKFVNDLIAIPAPELQNKEAEILLHKACASISGITNALLKETSNL